MTSHYKIKFACFFIFSIIAIGLVILNGFLMLENRDLSQKETLLTELNAKIGISQASQKRFYEELPELEVKHAELKKKVSDYRTAVQALETSQNTLANENQQLELSKKQLNKEIYEAQDKKIEADTALANLRLELSAKNEEIRSKESELSQLKAMQDTNKNLKKQQTEIEIHCSGLQAQSKQLNEKIKQQQKSLTDLEKENIELEASKNEIRNLDQKKRLVAKELIENQTQLNELTTQKNSIQDKLIDQKAILASLQNQIRELKETALQQQQVTGRLEQLESTLSARRMDLGKIEEEHQNRLSKNAAEIKNANQKILDLEAALLSEKQALGDIKKQIEQQQILLKSLKTSVQE